MKTALSLLAILAVLALLNVPLLSAEETQTPAAQRYYYGPRFVDADNDGVCDNYAAYGARPGRGNRMAGNTVGTSGRGRYFVDANNDGVCDNYGTRQGRRVSAGRQAVGRGAGLSRGHGRGYRR